MREFYLFSIVALLVFAPAEQNSQVYFPPAKSSVTDVTRAAQDGIDVLAYNAFMRPLPVGLGDDNFCRSLRIGDTLESDGGEYDLIAFTETFDLRATQVLRHKLEESYPYQVLRKPLREGLETNGGLSLFSKFPIENWTSKRFDDCSGTFNDCMAAKGFIHALVRVSEDVKFNVIATHLNSGGSQGSQDARSTQLDQIRGYLDQNTDIENWPTLLMGDLNVDGLHYDRSTPSADEYDRMMTKLGSICGDSGAPCARFPMDTAREVLGPWAPEEVDTRAVNTYNCANHGLDDCADAGQPAHVDRRQRLDYVISMGPPSSAPDRTLELRSASHRPMKDNSCDTTFLSDHAAIEASFDVKFGG
ncbi:MAG: endonuclease/exonuclease/phosphatase family protein [Myxococcota bacterium]